MKILLDEHMPWALRRRFPGHEVYTVHYMGWEGKVNGELLALAKDEFDALITMDRSIPFQRNLSTDDVAVIVVSAKSNGYEDLRPLIPEIQARLFAIGRGEVAYVTA